MKVAVLGDVGHATYHVGDEAMTYAACHELIARGHEPTVMSRDPAHTRRHLPGVSAARSMAFPWPPEDRWRYLGEIRDVLAGRTAALPTHDQVFAFIEELRESDALVIAGGGNMGSRYGWLLCERLAAIHVAASLGLPVFVTGQTVGPTITAPEARAAREALGLVQGIGAREPDTAALLADLAPASRVHRVLDDASFLSAVTLPASFGPSTPVIDGAVVVTVAPETLGAGDRLLKPLAVALDDVAHRTGAPVHLVPHMADPARANLDLDMHARLAAQMSADVTCLPIEHALVAAQRARAARLVVTSRYHPAVFAAEGATPVVALSPDRYTWQRLAGALTAWGRSADDVVDTERAEPEELREVVGRAVDSLDVVAAELRAAWPERAAAAGEFWDTVASALETGHVPLPAAVPFLDPAPASEAGDAVAPTVSVIVRTKERPVLLARALDDIAGQTFDDLEVVVVNDGGDPAPVDRAVADCVGMRGRARVVHRTHSAGMEAASNAGVDVARGELVAIHDDDDTWDMRFLASTVAHLRAHPEVDAVAGRTEIVWERLEDGMDVAVTEEREPFHGHLDEITVADQLRTNHLVPIGLLYRRSLHDHIGTYHEGLHVVGDWEFNLRLTRRGPVPVVGDRPLAFWHQRRGGEGAVSNSVLGRQRLHRSTDRLLRDARLRERLDTYGDGDLLYLAGFLQGLQDDTFRRLDELEGGLVERFESRLDEMHASLQRQVESGLTELATETRELGLLALARRKYHGVRGRLRRD